MRRIEPLDLRRLKAAQQAIDLMKAAKVEPYVNLESITQDLGMTAEKVNELIHQREPLVELLLDLGNKTQELIKEVNYLRCIKDGTLIELARLLKISPKDLAKQIEDKYTDGTEKAPEVGDF